MLRDLILTSPVLKSFTYLIGIEIILVYFIRQHLSYLYLLTFPTGGMLKAIEMINTAKAATAQKVTVDLHPNRPDFRGVTLPIFQMSLEADPTFDEIQAAGGIVAKNDKTHTILDDFFLVSGEIPRETSYENGIRRGARFIKEKGVWEKDELILDERFLMCKLKGMDISLYVLVKRR
jgi:7,8-dihydropterin-6-yl-methyl-4-(beta-D-ribofuranosyl)aminobenzene 5'-phosphate synthase